MTASVAVSTPATGGRGFPALAFIILVAFAFGIIYGSHAVERHGQDAIDVRKCMDSNGPVMVFKHRVDPIYYLLCRLDDGRWGVEPVSDDGHERTAFIPKDGTYKEVRAYLDGFADVFKGKLPWLK
jgi:hypothetical protein